MDEKLDNLLAEWKNSLMEGEFVMSISMFNLKKAILELFKPDMVRFSGYDYETLFNKHTGELITGDHSIYFYRLAQYFGWNVETINVYDTVEDEYKQYDILNSLTLSEAMEIINDNN